MQRTYSARERVLLSLFGFLCLLAGIAMLAIIVSNPEARRDLLAWAGALAGFGLSTVAVKIGLTGTAWPYFERKVVFRAGSNEDDA